MKSLILGLFWVGYLFAPILAMLSPDLIDSPCPNVLTHFERDPVTPRSRWSANIEVRPETPLNGFSLLIALTKPAELLGNMDGEVTTRNNKHFSIQTRKKFPAGVPISIRIFVKHNTDEPLVKTIKLNGVQICPPEESSFQTEPRRTLARPGERVTLIARAGIPLRHCHFYAPPNFHLIDLSQGSSYTPATARYEYHGRGLASGDCGIRFKRVGFENDGAVECRVQSAEGEGAWLSAASMVRVTNVSVNDLPVFEIVPKSKTVRTGDSITVTCNADRRLNLCQFYLPGNRHLNFDLGTDSRETREYRYHGDGLQYGHCGVTLTGVDSRLDGYLGCKLGRWPEQATGAWEADIMKLQVTGEASATTTSTLTATAEPNSYRPGRYDEPNVEVDHDQNYDTQTTTRTTAKLSTPPPTRAPRPQGNLPECGKTVAVSPVLLITLGQGTYRGQWPWHVGIYQTFTNGSLLNICGGTLIGARSVVTAAHCVTNRSFDRPVNPATLVVYAGKHHVDQWSDSYIQGKQVERVVVHPRYNSSAGFKNDLAVLVLRSTVNYTDFVRPVCLWDVRKTSLEEVEGLNGYVVGWGINERGYPTKSLMQATMPVVNHSTCLWSYPQHFLQFSRETTYCAGFRNGTSACNGDSGGGMVFPITSSSGRRWYLRGLVSNSVPRAHENTTTLVCDTKHYIVFTDLAQYLDWLTPYIHL